MIATMGQIPCGVELAKIGEELTAELGRLTRQNAKVKRLLQNKVNYTNFMLNLLYNPMSNLFSYDMQGNRKTRPKLRSLLDTAC
jgi:flagellar biosynthesis/type III secretory pathway chaperone